MQDVPHHQVLDASAEALRPAIQRAEKELAGHNLRRESYAVRVYREHGVISVSFVDRNAQHDDVLGSPGSVPAFEVDLEPDTLRVLAAHFVR